MKCEYGIVKDVYMIDDEIDKKIGFNIFISEKIKDVILEQNDDNSHIYVNDKVILMEDVICGMKKTKIELLLGDNDE